MNLIRIIALLASISASNGRIPERSLKKEKVCKAASDGSLQLQPASWTEQDSPEGCEPDFVPGESCFPKTCPGNFNVLTATLPVRQPKEDSPSQKRAFHFAQAAWVEGAQDETLFCVDPAKGYHLSFEDATEDDPVQRTKLSGHVLLSIWPPITIVPDAADKISELGLWWIQGGTVSVDGINCVFDEEEAEWVCADGVFTKAKGAFIDLCEYFEDGIMDHCSQIDNDEACDSDDLCAWDADQCSPDID